LNNSVVTGSTGAPVAAVHYCSLRNCTVTSNSYYGVVNSVATNCIVYYNSFAVSGSSLSYCCVSPSVSGVGNFTNAPQLFVDGLHLVLGSPCISAGINVATDTDIFGNTWANPPSVGCAEWQPAAITIPQLTFTSDPLGFRVSCAINAKPPFSCSWIKDGTPLQDDSHLTGTQTTNLIATGVSLKDPGNYQLIASTANGDKPITDCALDRAGQRLVIRGDGWTKLDLSTLCSGTVAALNSSGHFTIELKQGRSDVGTRIDCNISNGMGQ
jgi:hypothetical protein